VDIIDKVIIHAGIVPRKRGSSGGVPTIDGSHAQVYDFPYFTYSIKELYFWCIINNIQFTVLEFVDCVHRFVEETAAISLEKCMDEFYCTQIIYWDMLKYAVLFVPLGKTPLTSRDSFSEHKFPDKSYMLDLDGQKEEVISLARALFRDIRNRITDNVLLKCHNFFFMPMYVLLSVFWCALMAL
jgi:hypothetical protein